MSTIYEDVATLKEQMTDVQEDVSEVQGLIENVNTALSGLKVQTIEENMDLNTLGVGVYVIPNTSVCATLLNKPTTNNATAIVKVISGGGSGQLIMDYVPCANNPTYYHREYYSNTWHTWYTVDLSDSGWNNLTLLNNVQAYSSDQAPQYRKVGKCVTVRGVMKNITSFPTTIAQLPEGFRPSRRIIYFMVSNGATIARLEIETNGIMNVTYHIANNSGTVSDGTHYGFGTLTFLID